MTWRGAEGLRRAVHARTSGKCGIPGRSVDGEVHLALARRFATDALPLVDRVAGLFLLCYGQPMARMVRRTADHLKTDADGTSVRFGRTDLNLPNATGQLVRDLVTTNRGRAVTGTPERTPWLFPGAQPGGPSRPTSSASACPPTGSTPGPPART